MQETNNEITLPFISENRIAELSVSALSDRPNEHSGQYGKKGLSPAQLKEAFSALPKAIALRLNEVIAVIKNKLEALSEKDGELSKGAMGLPSYDSKSGKLSVVSVDGSQSSEAITDYVESETAKCVEKIEMEYQQDNLTYLYSVDKNGRTILKKASFSSEPSTVVYRDASGGFLVKDPQLEMNPVNKRTFERHTVSASRRIEALEYAASGALYETDDITGVFDTIQVGDALVYGVLSRIGGNVKTVTVGYPYDIRESYTFKGQKCTVNGRSVIMPKGQAYYLRFPCVLPKNAVVTVYADGENSQGETALKFAFFKGSNIVQEFGVGGSYYSATSAQFGLQVTLTDDCEYLAIYKSDPGTALKEDLAIGNIRVVLNDPSLATVMEEIDELSIPNSIIAMNGEYLDLTEGMLYYGDGTGESVATRLTAEADIITLAPYAALELRDVNGDLMDGYIMLSYKKKRNI